MSKFVCYLLFVCVFFTSCIPTQDLIYLQKKNNAAGETTIAAVEAKPYRLQTNDVISITIKAIDPKLVAMFSPSVSDVVTGKSESSLYFDGFTVDDHGAIRIPVLGELNVIGYTLEEVRLRVEKQLLAEYFTKEANIFVTVKLAGLRFTINGEIGVPGIKTIFQDQVTILEAVANSGDITITGDRKDVQIIRQFPQGTEIHSINLTSIEATKSPYFYLQPNDYIYVKPLKQKSWGTGKTGIESLGSIITILSLVTTTFLLLKK